MKGLSPISALYTLYEAKSFWRNDPHYYVPMNTWVEDLLRDMKQKGKCDIKQLHQLAKIIDVTENPENKNKFNYIDIGSNKGNLLAVAYEVRGEEAPSRARRKVRKGDLLTAVSGSQTGREEHVSVLIPEELDGSVASTGFEVIRPLKIDPYYLLALFNHPIVKVQIFRRLRGSAIPAVWRRDLENILVPLNEKLVEVGNKLKQAIEAKIEAEKKRKEIEEVFKKYFDIEMEVPQAISSIYTAQNARKVKRIDPKYFSPQLVIYEKLLYDSKLKLVPLGKLVRKRIRRGVQPQYDKEGEIPVIKTGNVYDGPIKWEKVSKVNIMFYRSNKDAQVPKNSLVVTSTGEGSWGRTSISTIEQAIADGHITIVEIDERIIDPYYVCAFLWTPYGKAQYERKVRGSTGQTEIYPMDIETIIIPQLSKEDENEIAKKMKIYFSNFYCSIELHSQAIGELNELLGLNSGGDKS
ncbi:Restriction endonuclease S subunit [Thermoanaerobacter thermohydrosulfuricus]|nr:Restriction endonuclease S subunit [Thermoanaerobacter thermohydrosulfuricus]